MNPSPPSNGKHVALVVCGVLFALIWIAAHFLWATMALMGTLMANDAGRATSDQHAAFIGSMLGGQILAAAAGIPSGLAFFWRGRRKWLWMLFGLLFVGGAVWQWLAAQSFLSSVSSHP